MLVWQNPNYASAPYGNVTLFQLGVIPRRYKRVSDIMPHSIHQNLSHPEVELVRAKLGYVSNLKESLKSRKSQPPYSNKFSYNLVTKTKLNTKRLIPIFNITSLS